MTSVLCTHVVLKQSDNRICSESYRYDVYYVMENDEYCIYMLYMYKTQYSHIFQLNVTREVRQKILEQYSRLESIDTQMDELVNSVHIAQNSIMAQRNDFKSLFDRSANQSQSLRRLTQRLQNDFTGLGRSILS